MGDISGLLAKYKEIAEERFFKEVYLGEEYKEILKYNTDVVLDVGACAGEFSAYIYPHAQIIYALEPFKEHFAELKSNVEEFNLTKIKPFELALSKADGPRYLDKLGGRGGRHLEPDTVSSGDLVETKSLASFMKEQGIEHIDLLKIDVEGAEEEIFSAPDFPEVADKISVIVGEHINGSGRAAILIHGFKEEGIYGANAVYIRTNG